MPSKLVSTKERTVQKKSGWKDIQTSAKLKKRSRLALLVLALLVGFLALSWTIRFTKSLFSPLESVNHHRNYVWNGEFNLNLLIRSSGVSVLTFNPKNEKVVIINIPDETYLDVTHGFGLWQLRAIYGLGGDYLLKEALTNFLAIPIDGFLDFSALKSRQSGAEIVDRLRKNPFSGLDLLSYLKTDLTIWELLRLKLGLSSVRFDRIKELNLDKLGLLEKENLPDGTEILRADPVKLDGVLSDLADPVVSSEHKSIAVFNATDHPQLALKWTRLITNLGGNVIITANAKARLNTTQVFGEQSGTLKRLRQIFDSGDKINPADEDSVSSRAQINLFLGEDRL